MTFEQARDHMVDAQLVARGIRDARVLAAMRAVPRHLFVGASLQDRAYDDGPLPIDAAQTISQPYMVALMTEAMALTGAERVLEVGTGSGYQTAVLAELAMKVFTIERIDGLLAAARGRLHALGYDNRITVRRGDGAEGWPEAAPFDAIMITAAARRVPRPLVRQLGSGGRLVLSLGEDELQGLARVRATNDGLAVDYFGECRFVKLIGEYGWEA